MHTIQWENLVSWDELELPPAMENDLISQYFQAATGKNIIAVGSHHNGGSSSPQNSKGIEYASGFSR